MPVMNMPSANALQLELWALQADHEVTSHLIRNQQSGVRVDFLLIFLVLLIFALLLLAVSCRPSS